MQLLPNSSTNIKTTVDVYNEMPSRTYRLDLENKTVNGFVDDENAMRQAISKLLMTWQNWHLIYTSAYGLDIHETIGREKGYVAVQMERRIKEALMVDRRILRVYDFLFRNSRDRNTITANFRVATRFGEYDVRDLEVMLR